MIYLFIYNFPTNKFQATRYDDESLNLFLSIVTVTIAVSLVGEQSSW